MISHQTLALSPSITQPPTPLLPQISRTAFRLNPAKTVSFPHNPTSPDLLGSVWITSPQLPAQPTRTQNVFECSVINAGESHSPSKDLPSAAEPPRSADPDSDPPATSTPSDSTPVPAAKPADKGKAPERTVAKEQPPIAKEPVAQPPIHPFSGIPSCYAPPANWNFTAPDKANDGAYQTMPPIYDIEQSKAVFERVLRTQVTISVGKLCSVSQDIRNQFRTAVTPKRSVGASANT
ncbi:hypothetical protein C0989_010256, partial [Termitomyces sp. Mn162]